MDIFEAKQRVAQIIEENQKQIIEVGEHIWKNPEPGYREFNTSAYLVKKLQDQVIGAIPCNW